MVQRVHALLFLTAFILLLPGGAGGASGPAPPDGVLAHWTVDMSGISKMNTTAGAAHLRLPAELGATRLRAEAVVLEVAWHRGVHVGGDGPFVKHVTDRGNDTVVLRDVDVMFDRPHAEPSFLVFSDEGPMRLAVASASPYELSPTLDETVVGVGASPDAVRAGDAPEASFWYATDAPTVKGTGGGSLRAEGSFTLFVHDQWIHAEGANDAWSDWTGYRESEPEGPVSEFELRVTTLNVTNGTFVSAAATGLDLFVSSLETRVNGVVASPGVTGRITQGHKVHVFEQDPLRLHGMGTISVTARSSDDATSAGPVLSLQPTGTFDVQGASLIEDHSPPEDDTASERLAIASVGSLALLATLGMMVLGVVPAPTRRSRRLQYKAWQRRGRRARDEGEWVRASRCFRQATRLRRDEPMAWFEWAQVELEAGNSERADEIAQRAAHVPGMDRLDLLDLRASAAWQRGDRQAFEEHLVELAKGAPGMARGLVFDLGIDRALLASRVVELLDDPKSEEVLDGYA